VCLNDGIHSLGLLLGFLERLEAFSVRSFDLLIGIALFARFLLEHFVRLVLMLAITTVLLFTFDPNVTRSDADLSFMFKF
jgi:hypothetical protein